MTPRREAHRMTSGMRKPLAPGERTPVRVVVAFNRPKTTASEGHWLQKSLPIERFKSSLMRCSRVRHSRGRPWIAEAIRRAGHETTILEISDPMQLMELSEI